MKQPVFIHIKGTQITPHDHDSTELFTNGELHHEDGIYSLHYEEADPDLNQQFQTTLTIDGIDSVSLMREGSVRTNMIIQRGSRNVGYYNTPYGELLMGVSSAQIENTLSQQGGRLRFRYALDINSSHVSNHDVQIHITLPPVSSPENTDKPSSSSATLDKPSTHSS